jgi:hypothetical protein
LRTDQHRVGRSVAFAAVSDQHWFKERTALVPPNNQRQFQNEGRQFQNEERQFQNEERQFQNEERQLE